MKRLLPVVMGFALLLLSSTEGWSADFQKGLAAAQRGDFATALREWKPLAEQGNARAQVNLGLMYQRGDGVPQNYKTAVKWYRLAGEQGNARAQINLGLMYENGKGVSQDDKTAVKWYRLAGEQGDAFGQNALGNMYDAGRGVPNDDKESAKWRTLAAEQGNSQSQYNLGVMYENGKGVSQDDKTAVKWYTLAGDQGNANAQRSLKRLQKDIAEQNKLRELQARAKQGDANAQYQLGTMYDNGQGVPKDVKEAVKWYRLAAVQGDTSSQKRFGELVLQDFVYGSDIRKLENLGKSVETLCKRNIKCAFDKVWAYLDITKDGYLSLSEIARFQRNIVKFAAVHQDQNVLKTEDIAAINLASIIFLPITASSILHSFDYNNDELLSKNEVLDDSEFSKLVGVNVDTLASGLDFQSLGEKLKDSMNQIPFLK